jgi:phage shock protein PspC (stress-responsive transcriptional regulator)
MIAGVCAGIAESKDWDPVWVRLIFVLLTLFTSLFPGILIYIILWIIMPER